MNSQDWFPLGLTGLISLQSKGLSRAFSSTTVQKHHFFGTQLSLWSNSHIHTWFFHSGKTMALTIQTFVGKGMTLLFNALSRFVIGLLPRKKCLLISWLQSPSAVILEPPKIVSLFSLVPHASLKMQKVWLWPRITSSLSQSWESCSCFPSSPSGWEWPCNWVLANEIERMSGWESVGRLCFPDKRRLWNCWLFPRTLKQILVLLLSWNQHARKPQPAS